MKRVKGSCGKEGSEWFRLGAEERSIKKRSCEQCGVES